MIKQIYYGQFLSFIFLVLISCKSADTVDYEEYVDTTTRPIVLQKKQTYALKDLGVYASNDFDAARMNDFFKSNDSTAVLVVNPENQPINQSTYYAFKIWSDIPKTFYVAFEYPKGFKHRYIPKLKKTEEWSIIDPSKIIKRGDRVLIKLELNKTPLTIAAQEINTSSDVKKWAIDLSKGKESYVNYSVYGKSKLGRDLPVLDIYKGAKKGKDIVVLLTRQHPPEVTGYFAYQEFLKTILNDVEWSDLFLKKYRVLAFPILNPDGVDLGHWRYNAGGVDTNRDWSKYHQPEIRQTVDFITKIISRDHARLVLGIDFHSTYRDVFYTNQQREGTTFPNFIDDWFGALEKNIPNYKVNEAPGNSTKPVSKAWFLYGHSAVGITYEIGDTTPKSKIETIGKVSAEQMMKILLKNN